MTGSGISKRECEGGCGVIGFAASEPKPGRHLITPLEQMHNRGNGKGGGLAVVGCFLDRPDAFALQVGYLKGGLARDVEERFIAPYYVVHHREEQPEAGDHRDFGLEVRPPRVVRYFVTARPDVLAPFAAVKGLDTEKAEEQLVVERSFALSKALYGDVEDKAAFVLSHGKRMMVLKGVGYAEQIARFYALDDFQALAWIGHQRYPTRGRVWHPGGAHPFIGLHDALVHNGDFANYHAVAEYLKQKGMRTLYFTDTEVAALLFDHYNRVLEYPIEILIEALAPTSERDFELLPKARQRLYRAIRAAHLHGSPDGPWFFIIARSVPREGTFQLLGITDTSMLRPHVFALYEGEIGVGAVASERQAIDRLFANLAAEDPRIAREPDHTWTSRGGSHTDGGSFVFTVAPLGTSAGFALSCADKFGKRVVLPQAAPGRPDGPLLLLPQSSDAPPATFASLAPRVASATYEGFRETAGALAAAGRDPLFRPVALETLTELHDRRYPIGDKKRSWIRSMTGAAIDALLASVPLLGKDPHAVRTDRASCRHLPQPLTTDQLLVIDASGFPPEGDDAVCRAMVHAYRQGWRRFVVFRCKGDRFIGCGLGPGSRGVRIDLYGSSGDYTGSGVDGAEIHIHGDGQDQLGQIMNDGKIVIHGNVGQTFLYGAKGGTAYVLGSTAGRPLINSVGTIRAIVNGTCLDYAAESFMAGHELGGGFVLLNGLAFSPQGEVLGLEDRYPGGNLFSLASGGAFYLNDPYARVSKDQLNGAKFTDFTQDDWNLLRPYLEENERLFGIAVERDLLTVDRVRKAPAEIFRKVVASKRVLMEVEY
ncbi:MAG: glutamate synthase [Acidobacteriota bacterium]